MKMNPKLETVFNDVLWRCGDCNNVYTLDIKHCPNDIIDGWIITNILKLEEMQSIYVDTR